MMQMVFYNSWHVTLWVPLLTSKTATQYACLLLFVVLFAIAHEGIYRARQVASSFRSNRCDLTPQCQFLATAGRKRSACMHVPHRCCRTVGHALDMANPASLSQVSSNTCVLVQAPGVSSGSKLKRAVAAVQSCRSPGKRLSACHNRGVTGNHFVSLVWPESADIISADAGRDDIQRRHFDCHLLR